MTELMRLEMQESFYLFFGALAVMMLFSVRDGICNRCSHIPRLRNSLYLLFWILGAFLVYEFAYRGGYGSVSWYSLAFFGGGIVLWKKGLCGIITLYESVQKQVEDLTHEKEK